MKKEMILWTGMLGLMCCLSVNAQSDVAWNIGADVVSSYIWRGQDFGGMAVQPGLRVGCHGLSLSAWGSYGLTDKKDTRELDFTLAYETGGLTAGVTDYYCLTDGSDYAKLDYFEYRARETAHVFEAFVSCDFGLFSLSWYTNFAGADGLDSQGERAYSSYVEAAAPFQWQETDFRLAIGAVPYATDFYANADSGFSVTYVALTATKTVPVTESSSMPVFLTIAANPSTSKCYMTFGISF